MISLPQCATIISLVDTARAAGARLVKACALLGLTPRTVLELPRFRGHPIL